MGCNCNRGWQGVVGQDGVKDNLAHHSESEPSQYQQRLLLCASCGKLRRLHGGLPPGADVGLLDRCGECGCLVKAKAFLSGQRCPLGKW